MWTFSCYLELPRGAAIRASGDMVLRKVGRDHDYISLICMYIVVVICMHIYVFIKCLLHTVCFNSMQVILFRSLILDTVFLY